METVFSILTVIFIAILLTTALTFGFTILVFFLSVALLTAVLIFLRGLWFRWLFLRSASQQERQAINIIETEYTDITDEDNT